MTNNILNINQVNVHSITNLYLYGTLATPTSIVDKVRSQQEYDSLPTGTDSNGNSYKYLPIQVDMESYMVNGAGRYAHASNAYFVKDFFDPNINLGIPDGSYTKEQIKSILGYSDADMRDQFNFELQHFRIDTNSSDYAERTYIFNSSGYTISSDAVFVINGNSRYVENMAVHAFQDNFDFDSNSLLTELGNTLDLEESVDPHGIGVRVNIDFENKENVPVVAQYTALDFLSDTVQTANEADYVGVLTNLYPAMIDVVDELNELGTVISTLGSIIGGISDDFASTWGDPHLVTFDGMKYDFQKPGEYVLVGSTADDFEVQVRQELVGGSSNISINTAVSTSINGIILHPSLREGFARRSSLLEEAKAFANDNFCVYKNMVA